MVWYRFWKKSGPMQYLDEKYIWLDKKIWPNEESIEPECEAWAESIPGGHNTRYKYGFEKLEHPPKKELEKMINNTKESIKNQKEKLDFLQETLRNSYL